MAAEIFNRNTLGELLTIQAGKYPERPYLRQGEKLWTYAQVEDQTNALAAGLHGLGLKLGDRVAVLLPNVPAFVLTLFAVAKTGMILVPINVRRHPTELLERLGKTGSRIVITFSDPASFHGVDHLAVVSGLSPDLPALEHVVALDDGEFGTIRWRDLLASPASLSHPEVQPEDPATILHTLGSSGQARGAVLAHTSLVRNAATIASNLACTPEDIFLGTVPFSNAFGITATILACTVAGAQLVCLPKYNPGSALACIESDGITIHHGVPTMFSMELNHASFAPGTYASLRTGIMAGAPCPPELVRRVRQDMGFDILLAYGLTEASPSVAMTRFGDGPVTATETVGRPHDGVEVKLIGPSGEKLPPGQEGELCVRGYNVMLGYWEDAEATESAIDREGWLHTGDLATIDPDGVLRIQGRKDDVINRGGIKIHPGTVEMVLRSFPGVKEAAVVGVPDLVYGELSCACVVRQPDAQFTEEDLLAYTGEHLAEHAIPDRVLFFEALPRHGSGPVQKDYLRERVRIRGRAWKFGQNIDTDAIIPARRCNTADPAELARFCMEDADPEFVNKVRRGDLIIAETNFGCGSSREVAPLSIKAAGVSAVIAKSFARIFFRNAINIGLPIMECPEAVDGIQEGDDVEVEPATGIIRNLTRDLTFQAQPFPDFLRRIIDSGGLLAYVEERLAGERQ